MNVIVTSVHAVIRSIRNLFRRKEKLLVGIDISSTAIKALVLSCNEGVYRVENYGVIALAPNAVVENDIKDSDIVAKTLEALVYQTGISEKEAAIAVPDSTVISKVIQVEANLSSNEIEAQIMTEAKRYIPYPIDEVSFDFEVLGSTSNKPHLVDVFIVASHTENIQSRVAALKKGGMSVKVAEVESFAVERACQLMSNRIINKGINKIIAVLDVGATLTTLTVLSNGSAVFTRSEVFGGRQLTDEIQRHYGLPLAEAGLAKKLGGLPEDYATEVLQPFKDSLILYIRRALQFYFSASQQQSIDLILLAGGTSAIQGLSDYVQEQIGVTTQVVNPLLEMAVAPRVNIEALSNDVPALLICTGLALRSFSDKGMRFL